MVVVSQVFGSIGAAVGYTVSTVVATDLAGSTAVVGFTLTASSLCTIAATALIARITDARGRRAGLVFGYLAAAVGAAVCVAGITMKSFPVFVIGGVLVSLASVTNFQSRFAVADLAGENDSSRGISIVVWVTTIGGIAGPNASALGMVLGTGISLPAWAGVYLIAGAGFALAAVVLACLLRPDPLLLKRRSTPAEEQPAKAGALTRFRAGAAAIRGSGTATFAVVATAVGHTVMVSVMTWTPVHMTHGESAIGVIGLVLSAHFAGMFAFSPVFGWLASRIGPIPVITASTVVMLAALVVGGTAPAHEHVRLGVALFLLGLGWCGMFVTGSALLTDSVEVDARPAAQGLSDVVMWTGSAIAAAGAGTVHEWYGFGWLNVLCGVLVLPALVLGVRHLVAGRS
ncbi:MFS transporter [Lentzea sp. NPDC006480]|uniref:MFS transporter n=1 Tax=Lentzea sp. NPDC006480 TaxID=3157176 RepID=UPI0033BD36C3